MAPAYSQRRSTIAKRAKLGQRVGRYFEEIPGLGNRLLAMTASALSAAQDQMLLLGRKTATEGFPHPYRICPR